jgi:DNA invertase Pin-like site-specific DNA recombinase
MAKLGYVRVSTSQQSLTTQIQRLINEGVREDRIYSDKASGKNDDREGLQRLMHRAEKDDLILITKLDRLGRNTADMIRIIEDLSARGVHVRFLDDGISTEGSMGKMVVTILAAVAQAERERIMERTNEGRLEAKSKGIQFGRKRTVDHSKVYSYLKDHGATQTANHFDLSRSAVYKIKKQQLAEVTS